MSIQSINSTSSALLARGPSVDTPVRAADDASVVRADADTAKPEERKATETPSVQEVVKEVNEFVKPFNNSLQFSIDDDTGTTVVKVIDMETEKVIKQLPSEEMLALAKAIGQLKGLLVKQEA